MNAEAYLRKHGWGGPGSALQPTKPTSLKRPLLVAKKVDVLGLGLSKTSVSDQWWLRAFDDSLKAMGTGRKGMLADVAKHGARRGGLYGFFVKGEGLQGTIAEQQPIGEKATKRKADVGDLSEKADGKQLSANKRRKYAARAVDRGISLDAYLASRSTSRTASAAPTSTEVTEAEEGEDEVSRLAAQILARSRGSTKDTPDLPVVSVGSITGPFSAAETRAARKAARAQIRARREARRAKRTKV